MYRRLLVAYDESPESQKALLIGIEMAKTLGAELHSVTVEEGLPPYISAVGPYATYVEPRIIDEIQEQRDKYYAELQENVCEQAQTAGVSLHAAVVAGHEVEAIVEYARLHECDLILVGFHKHSAIAERFWGSTAHGITMRSHCSVLAVK
jgi:nucleotide-binding universal stress UspA family protein